MEKWTSNEKIDIPWKDGHPTERWTPHGKMDIPWKEPMKTIKKSTVFMYYIIKLKEINI